LGRKEHDEGLKDSYYLHIMRASIGATLRHQFFADYQLPDQRAADRANGRTQRFNSGAVEGFLGTAAVECCNPKTGQCASDDYAELVKSGQGRSRRARATGHATR
jgi:hypothetical protein